MEQVIITDVAARDGLQNQPVAVGTDQKIALLEGLRQAGVRRAEATSFVSPRAVPQMADAAEVLAGVRAWPGLQVSVLVPNLKGLERAAAAGAREVAVVLSATETMNRKNINMGLEEATRVSLQTLGEARRLGLRSRAYLAVAFECPFEGLVDVPVAVALARRLLEAGVDELVVADTIGAAAPVQVRRWLQALLPHTPADRVGAHFHDTRGMGVANAQAALDMGVRRLDASVGGIGGCPFAPGASGNVATEDLVVLAHQSGFDTGIDADALIDVVDLAQAWLGPRLGGKSLGWLRRQRARREAAAG